MSKRRGIAQIVVSFILFLVACWGLMWMFSSSSLASGACENSSSLFHENFRCRQPYFAAILWITTGIMCVAFLIKGVKELRSKHNAS